MDDQAMVSRYLGTRGLSAGRSPEAVLVVGPPATGKTRWRFRGTCSSEIVPNCEVLCVISPSGGMHHAVYVCHHKHRY